MLGYCAASFSVDRYPCRDENAYICFSTPGKQMARYGLRNGRTVFLLVWAADAERSMADHDAQARRAIVKQAFKGVGWESENILQSMSPPTISTSIRSVRCTLSDGGTVGWR